MTPPINEQVVEALPVSVIHPGTGLRFRRLDDLLLVGDAWAALIALWTAKLLAAQLDQSVALLGITTFVLMSLMKGGRDALVPSALDELGNVIARVAVGYALVSGLNMWLSIGSQRTLFATALVLPVLFLGGRSSAYAIERKLREAKGRKALIVGGGEVAGRIVRLLKDPAYGLEVAGVCDDDPKLKVSVLGARMLESLDDASPIVAARDIDEVIVAYSSIHESKQLPLIHSLLQSGANVRIVPRFFELGGVGRETDLLREIPLVKLQPLGPTRPEWLVKRAIDVAAASFALLVTAPISLLVALAVLIDSGRPIFHRQVRVGAGGRLFEIIKFRTMLARDQVVTDQEWVADDSHVTKVGRFLRDTSLDELPQLFNVIKGEMSLVGPRPERPHFVEEFGKLHPRYGDRLRFPAGITGWSQVHKLRGDTSIEDRTACDNYYIDTWSVGKDLKILVRTAAALRTKEGGERERSAGL